MASYDGGRVAALSGQLAQAHEELRERLARVRAGLGSADAVGDEVLSAHCLAFCTALSAHHQGEDEGMFAQLVAERPELAGTVAKLVEDHALIAEILLRVRTLAGRAAGTVGPEREAVGRELDGLAAIMESHFGYEERAIGAALDRGGPEHAWAEQVFRFGAG